MSVGLAAVMILFFFFQAEDGIRDVAVTGVQTCALPISWDSPACDPTAAAAESDTGDDDDEALRDRCIARPSRALSVLIAWSAGLLDGGRAAGGAPQERARPIPRPGSLQRGAARATPAPWPLRAHRR